MTRDLLLGFTQTDPAAPRTRVWLDSEERRRTHALVIGSPGSGKTKFLEWLIRGDIRNGQGVCVIDPHGELYDNILNWCAYRNYLGSRKVVLLDPSRSDFVLGFNPFRPKAGMALDVQVNSMVEALLRVWGAEDTSQTPTLDRVLRLLFTAMVSRSMPLHEAHQLVDFSGRKFRKDVISTIAHPAIRAEWDDLNSLARSDFRAEVLSAKNRLFKLVTSECVRRFMGSTEAETNVDLVSLMDEGAIVLVNLLPTGQLDPDIAKAFGALLINEIFRSAMVYRGKATTGRMPRPFYVYIDEWQTLVTPDVAHILAEARKFGVNLILANQDPAQIAGAFDEAFLDTVMTCCRIKACFGGLNERSGQRMAREMLLGQIDLNEAKHVLYSTKFWPRYTRDVVRTESRSRGGAHGRTRGQGTVEGWAGAVGTGSVLGTSFDVDGNLAGSSATFQDSRTWSRSGGTQNSESESDSETWGDGEAVADVPILIPEPFSEATSVQLYSLEDQLWRWTARLVNQYERHCFLKMPGTPTMPLLIPFVQQPYVLNATVKQYEATIAELTGARTPTAVDEALTVQEQAGVEEVQQHQEEDFE